MLGGFPSSIFRYELLEDAPVGRGGCGTIWKAYDRLFGRQVAIKTINEHLLLRDDPRVNHAFVKEAMAGARLGELSRHIVPVTDLGISDGIPYFVMPWIEPSLNGLIDISRLMGKLTVAQTKVILFQIGEALRVAHAHGVAHSDVAPWNVIHSNEDNTYKLTDFGLLKIIENRLLSVGSGSLLKGGRADFQPPVVRENVNNVSYSSDVYALAVTMRVLLEGDGCLSHKGGRVMPTPSAIWVRHQQRDAPDEVRQLLKRFVDQYRHERDQVDHLLEMLRRIPD